jgi:hypothetical protein
MDSSVRTATNYGLDGLGFDSRQKKEIFNLLTGSGTQRVYCTVNKVGVEAFSLE